MHTHLIEQNREKSERYAPGISTTVIPSYDWSWFGGPGYDMKTVSYTYWRDGRFFIGFLNSYPDYQTQALSKKELGENLKDLLADIESGQVPHLRKVEELLVA